jgi:hypothetical protein
MTMEQYVTRKDTIQAVEITEVDGKYVKCCDGCKRLLSTYKAEVGDMVIISEGRGDVEHKKDVEKWVAKEAFDKKYMRGR